MRAPARSRGDSKRFLWHDPAMKHLRLFPALGVFLVSVLLAVAPAANAPSDEADGLDHPAIREVLAMVEAGVGNEVILARVERMKTVPELSGEEIAALRKKGVGDRVLLALIERGGRTPVPPAAAAPAVPPPATPPASAVPPKPAPGGTAAVRVVLESGFPLNYLEVRLDGETVHTLGRALRGESEQAGFLPRPETIRPGKDRVVFERAVPPGRHEIDVGFAVTRVEGDPEDEWHEYSREAYASSGVGLEGSAVRSAGDGEWSDRPPAVCEVTAGATCEVVVTPRKQGRARGGLTSYGLSYRVSVR